MPTHRALALTLFAALVPACTDHHDDGDAAPDVTIADVATIDTVATDASIDAAPDVRPDAPPDVTAPSDTALDAPTRDTSVITDASDATDAAVVVAECAPSALVNLNTVGTRTGVVTRYTTSTTATPAMIGLAAPHCQDVVAHALVFRYTTTAAATLRVSTNNAGTTFDTVAWMLDRCGTAATMELGCSDDDNHAPHDSASTFESPDRVAAGSTVYIVVAGMGTASGTVELTLAELADVPLGGVCDPTRETTTCVPAPSDCITSGGTSHCEAPRYIESGLAPPVFLDACAHGTRVALAPHTAGGDPRDTGHAAAAVSIPFAFSFFGSAVTNVWPSTNGYAVFGSMPTDSPGGDGAMPMPEEGPIAAPFWQNLTLRAAPGSDICTGVFGTAPSRQFAIEWLDAMPRGNTTSHVTFEIVLNEGTNAVDFVYLTLDPGTSPPEESDGTWSAIGLQSARGERVILHDGSVDTMNAVHFATAM